jgi:hypothetical protein
MSDLVNAPIPLKVGDREYFAMPPTLGGWQFLMNAMREEYIAEMGDDSLATRLMVYKSLGFGDLMTWLQTPKGLVRLVYQLFHERHPEITDDLAWSWIIGGEIKPKRLLDISLATAPQSDGQTASPKKRAKSPA